MKIIIDGIETELPGSAEEVYSGEEVRIGTWFGKPVYRKVEEFQFQTRALPTNFEEYPVDYSGREIINVSGYCISGTTESWAPVRYSIPYTEKYNGEILGLSVKQQKNTLFISYRANGKTTFHVYLVVLYTKTTD